MKIIAEIGSVHDGSFGNACKLIEAAAACGADAVKFQTHIAEAETLANAPSPGYFQAESRIDYFKRTGFSKDQWKNLKKHCADHNVKFLSSPFSLEAVDWLEDVNVEAYKIPSGEVSNIPLLVKVAKTQKPVLLSSGMSNWKELDAAVSALKSGGPLTILQCSSIYPCPPEKVGINVIAEMKARYNVAVGFSDHTLSFAAPLAAAANGATVIEKHFTFSKLMYGSDAKHSMEPEEFKRLCIELHDVWKMMSAPVNKDDLSGFKDMKRIFEKSIVASMPLKAGAQIRIDDLAFKKPGDGINASEYLSIVGKTLVRDLPADHKFTKEDFK